MLAPLVSTLIGGPGITTESDVVAGGAAIGRPIWDPRALLAQLELRLGLPRPDTEDVVRLQRWSACLRDLANDAPRFYSESFIVDPLGTAKSLLEWRDELILAGWDGQSVPGGGPRLAALSEIEARAALAEHAPGLSDRLQRVVQELNATRVAIFERIELAEARAVWPELWCQAFALLERNGVTVMTTQPSYPGATVCSDLAQLQRALREDRREAVDLTGDGSVVLLEAETAWELGQATAALLRAESIRDCVVIRAQDQSALDTALRSYGLASQGLSPRSAWRPPLQVLPLMLELAFHPRDPQRVFELVTLPEGPFRGQVGRELGKALAEAPGIGGLPWLAAKQRLRHAGVDEPRLERVASWLEGLAHDPVSGAPPEALRQIAQYVIEWLQEELTRGHTALANPPFQPGLEQRVEVLGAALGRARAFDAALRHERRAVLRLVDVRHVLEEAAGEPLATVLSTEGAGRIDHVARPAGVRASRDVVLWWYCAEGTEWRPAASPWRMSECRALDAAGVRLVDQRARLTAEAESWLAPVFAARQRLILVYPHCGLGQALGTHPLIDEIAARVTKPALSRIRVHLGTWLSSQRAPSWTSPFGAAARITRQPTVPLPHARPSWRLSSNTVPKVASHSASSLEAFASCPLKWMLRYGAGLYPAANRALARGPRLYGKLAHRLVEELQASGALGDPERTAEQCRALCDRLIAEEAALLLCSGQRIEAAQLKAQLQKAVNVLSRWLAAGRLQVIGVERQLEASWCGTTLSGRVDLLLADASGHEIVLDLKWGASHYEELLKKGRALQLAIYCRARQLDRGSTEMPRSAYFSLSNAKFLTRDPLPAAGDGPQREPSAVETWSRLAATATLVQSRLDSGRVDATGVTRSLPIWVNDDGSASDGTACLPWELGAGCTYCDYGAICGRRWEAPT